MAAKKKTPAKKAAPKTAVKKAAAVKAVKPDAVGTVYVPRTHTTNRYATDNGPKIGDAASKATNARHAIESDCANGSTIAGLVSAHGSRAYRNMARHALRGGLVIAGLKIGATEKPLSDDGIVADRIRKLPTSAKIKYNAGYSPRKSATA